MTGLREMLVDLASAPAPPSPAVAARLYAEGRRRHQRRRATLAGAVATVVAAVAVLGGVAANLSDRGGTAPAVPPTAGPNAPSAPVWVGAADASHLYAAVACCLDAAQKGSVRVMESVDAGRTWTAPGDRVNFFGLTVLAPGTLLASDSRWAAVVSVDGGQTWGALTLTGGSVDSGGTLVCLGPDACTVGAADLERRTVAPLTQGPPIRVTAPESLVPVAGTTYVTGWNPQSQRPALAWTRDGGRSWASHTFSDAVACTPEQCAGLRIASADGITAYAEIIQPYTGRRLTYHTSGGAWKPIVTSNIVPNGTGWAPPPFIAKDGTYVTAELVHDPVRGRDGLRFWALTGPAFVPVVLSGLPANVRGVSRTPDGWFFTLSYPDQVPYGSTDGWFWSPVIP